MTTTHRIHQSSLFAEHDGRRVGTSYAPLILYVFFSSSSSVFTMLTALVDLMDLIDVSSAPPSPSCSNSGDGVEAVRGASGGGACLRNGFRITGMIIACFCFFRFTCRRTKMIITRKESVEQKDKGERANPKSSGQQTAVQQMEGGILVG